MNRPVYTDVKTPDFQTYFFNSIGKQGTISKIVVFSPLQNLKNGYNLGFGTIKINEDGKRYIDGEDRANNGDINKIFSTVAKIIEIYTGLFPERQIYFTGYVSQLTKLYQRAILSDYELISKEYIIWGDKDSRIDFYEFENFNPGISYYGFLLKKR